MTPTVLMQMFIDALNAEYTKRDINGVAVAHQSTNGAPVWRVSCEFETHTELYQVGIAPNAGWHFERMMTEEEYGSLL